MPDPASPPLVSVVVACRNTGPLLRDCLASLVGTAYPPDRREILVVDNGSSDGTVEIAGRYPVRLLSEARRGIPCARNRGILAARGDIIALTDPDCVASRGWLPELVHAFERGIGAVAGETVAFPGASAAERYAARRASHSQRRPLSHPSHPFAMASNIAFRREAFAQAGLFDPRFPGGGWEDADLCWRLLRATPLRLGYAPRAIVFHRYRTTAGAFFVQHLRYGYGLALVSAKHAGTLPWGWRQGFEASGGLGRTMWALGAVLLRGARDGRSAAAQELSFDLLRQLGQRIGWLRGALARRRRTA